MKTYVGETGRGLNVRLKEHKRDVGNHDTKNALVSHIETCGSLPDWERADVIEKDMQKSVRKAMEAAHILLNDVINIQPEFFTWTKVGAKIALNKR